MDLYAGTGALGIEALSRGADTAVFVDRSRPAAAVIRRNLELTRLTERGMVHRSEVLAFLRWNEPAPDQTFDLAFLDPPYEDDVAEVEDGLVLLEAQLRPGWTVVLTRAVGSSMPVIPLHWVARRHLRYGDSLLISYRED